MNLGTIALKMPLALLRSYSAERGMAFLQSHLGIEFYMQLSFSPTSFGVGILLHLRSICQGLNHARVVEVLQKSDLVH